jgi:hypothetical protein
MGSKSRCITFDELCELEPRLRMLYDEAASIRDDPTQESFCANNVWYGYFDQRGKGFKSRLKRLVGELAGCAETPNTLGIPETGEPVTMSMKDLMAAFLEEVPADPATDPRLRTSEAYDVAYETIYNALPDCRNCGCP